MPREVAALPLVLNLPKGAPTNRIFLLRRISRPRALHHHGVAAMPAKAILRISARFSSNPCRVLFCLHARVRENCVAGCFYKHPPKKIQVEDLHLAH